MSSDGRRERSLPLDVKIGLSEVEQSGVILSSFSGDRPVAGGTQVTVSENHHYDSKHGHYDGGGPFYTDKLVFRGQFPWLQVKKSIIRGERRFAGQVFCNPPTSSQMESWFGSRLSLARSEDTSDLDPWGAKAISICSPVNPVSGLSTGVSEGYREGLPSLPGVQTWRRRTGIAKSAGSEYLNLEFGWLPLISEITDVRDAARHQRDILNQYHKDEGKQVRRGFEFPIDHSSQTVDNLSGRIVFTNTEGGNYSNTEFNGQCGTWSGSATREKSTRKWFSGAFTYGLPSQDDSWKRSLGFGTDADKLYGIALSPDIVWELTPWSWAVDWFTNTGNIINNVTNFVLAGQVMRYGYMMEETIDKVTQTYKNSGGTEVPAGSVVSLVTERISKVRRPANPFGFGLTFEGLSPTQVLIGAALGLTLV